MLWLMVFVELNVVGKFAHLAIDAHTGEAFGSQTTDQFRVRSLFAPNHWRKQLIASAVRKGQDLIDHFIDGLSQIGRSH